jgi:ATPases involved in chromosome partitioning
MNTHFRPVQTEHPVRDHLGDSTTARPLTTTTAIHTEPLPYGFIALFQTIETLRVPDRSFIIQFVAPHPGAGTSTVAAGFAIAAAQSYRRPVLLVDAGAPYVAGPLEPVPTDTAYLMKSTLRPRSEPFIDPAETSLENRLADLRRHYHAIVIDCPALGRSAEAVTIARHCDGTALIAAAARSSAREMLAARDAITQVGGQILGAVFNRERSYRPRWLGGQG